MIKAGLIDIYWTPSPEDREYTYFLAAMGPS